jgi:hypothetical protein
MTFAELGSSKPFCAPAAATWTCRKSVRCSQTARSPSLVASLGSTDLWRQRGRFLWHSRLERIGTQVILHYLRALLFRLAWDWQQQLQRYAWSCPSSTPAACGPLIRANRKAWT